MTRFQDLYRSGFVVLMVLLTANLVATDAPPVPGPDAARFILAPTVSDGPMTLLIEANEAFIQGWSFGLCHDPGAVELASFGASGEVSVVRDGYPPEFYVCEIGHAAPRSGIVQAAVLAFQESMALPSVPGGFPVLNAEYRVLAESSLEVCDGLRGQGEPVPSAFTVNGLSQKPAETVRASLVQKPYAGKLSYKVEPPESSEVVTVKLYADEIAVEGWSFALCHSAAAASVIEMATSPELERLVNGDAPQLVINEIAPAEPFVAVRQTVLLGSVSSPVVLGPFPEGLPLLGIRYAVTSDDTLKFCDKVGDVSFENRISIDGIGYVPRARLGANLVAAALGTKFIRGDADLDGLVNITDAVYTLMALFLGGEALPCLDAADANDVGRVDISDPIFTLRFLFLGGPQIPAPFPTAGEDLSPPTALGCERGLSA